MRKDVLNQVNKLRGNGLLNKSELARRFGCNRRTVDRYLKDFETKGIKREYSSILDEFKSIIQEKVDTYGASSMAVFKFIQKKGYAGGYLTVNNFVKKHKDEEINKATIRFETTPGLQAQVDWKEKLTMINRKGETFVVNIFLIVLGYSRLKFTKLTSDKRQKTLFECMFEAFRYFQGIPHEILFDNMKTVVDRHKSTFKNVVINDTFKIFAQDAGFEVLTCRAYRAKTKGKVETLAKLVDRLKVYNGEFDTFEELERIVEDFNNDINNEISQATNEKPFDRFKVEKEYLSPLPTTDLLLSYFHHEKEYKVYKDSMINYKGQKYSVPTRFIGKYVNAYEVEDIINIYYTEDLIASHPKSEKLFNYTKDHAIEILKSDALKGWDESSVEDFVENNLRRMDIILN
ncbi:UNVERIFIED_CONTAM: transposase [Acetivibrio alkalicellulosi]